PAPSPEPVVEENPAASGPVFGAAASEVKITNGWLEIAFSSTGGVLRRVVIGENPENGVRGLPGENGDVVLQDSVAPDKALGWLPFAPCGEMESAVRDRDNGDREVSFRGSTADGGLEVVKTYVIHPEKYLLDLEISVKNLGATPLALPGGASMVCGSMGPIDPQDSLGVDVMTPTGIQRQSGVVEPTAARIAWLALKTKYFTSIVKPREEDASSYRVDGLLKEVAAARAIIGCGRGAAASPYEYLSAVLSFKERTLSPGETLSRSFVLYLGPSDYNLLREAGFGFEDVINLGMLAPLCKAIIWLLDLIYGFIGSYGWAIIFLTLIVKIVLWPLTHKSFKSMKEMQKLQPKIQALKEKCKGDSKKLQAETMKLYKEHGVNPMSGCLPMLLQMPILFALYNALRNTILLRNAPFWIIPGRWIRDLSGPDRLATLPQSYPIIGDQVNILPLLMGLTFYLQQKLTPQAPAANDQAAQQQKMMGTLMPVLFTLMFYTLPSGLNLYFTLSTVITILQQGALQKRGA
nr:membrane protein insertase YidC [bacterium]